MKRPRYLSVFPVRWKDGRALTHHHGLGWKSDNLAEDELERDARKKGLANRALERSSLRRRWEEPFFPATLSSRKVSRHYHPAASRAANFCSWLVPRCHKRARVANDDCQPVTHSCPLGMNTHTNTYTHVTEEGRTCAIRVLGLV